MRARHSLRAIAASHAGGSRGTTPATSARCAERKTCCTASSASTGSRRRRRHRPSTIRLCTEKSRPRRAPAAPASGRPVVGKFPLVVASLVSSRIVVVTLVVVVVALVVIVLPRDRLSAREVDGEGDHLTYQRCRKLDSGRKGDRQRRAVDADGDRPRSDGK